MKEEEPLDIQEDNLSSDRPPDIFLKKNEEISPELRKLFQEEAVEAEIQAAIDAALEEGIIITREEAIKILKSPKDNQKFPQK